MKKLCICFMFLYASFSHSQSIPFTPAQKLFTHPVDGLFGFAFIPVDYDKNGTTDYIGRANNELVVFMNDGNEYVSGGDVSQDEFSRPYVITDFNGDGWDDIIMEFFILEYDPIAEIYQPLNLEEELRTILAVGDFNNDELNDVITSSSFGSSQADLSIHYNNGNTFTKVSIQQATNVGPLRVGDLEGDGDIDIAYVEEFQSNSPVLLVNDGQGNFTKRNVQANAILLNRVLEFDDIDGDGDLDILIADINEQLQIYENTDDFISIPTKHLVDYVRPISNKIVDLNNDGKKEIVSFNFSLNTFALNVYYSSGGLSYGNKQVVATINAPSFFISLNANYTQNALSLYDVENDGDVDIVLNFSVGDDPSVLLYENSSLSSTQDQVSFKTLNVYPNPTSDFIDISDLPSSIESESYVIYSADGKIVKRGLVQPRISINDLAQGLYKIIVLDNKKVFVANFIVQH